MPIIITHQFVTSGSRQSLHSVVTGKLSHLLALRDVHYQNCAHLGLGGLSPGPKFTKLGGGLQQAPLRHPAKFQPDCKNGLRDIQGGPKKTGLIFESL